MIRFNSTIEHASGRLPANFDGLRAIATKVEGVFITHELGCGCGGEAGSIAATPINGNAEYLDPVVFHCMICDNSVAFFDSSRDGYDGRLNGGASFEQGSEPQIISCKKCGTDSAKLICGLAYNTDFETDESPELVDAVDYFDAIDINFCCNSCGMSRHVGAWELA